MELVSIPRIPSVRAVSEAPSPFKSKFFVWRVLSSHPSERNSSFFVRREVFVP